jgi:CheY-like chemotaxis protein
MYDMAPINSRLLVVDDSLDIQTTMRRILALEGYHVLAVSGNTALDLIQSPSEAIDLILSDLRMPDVSGLELLSEARDCRPHTPFVVYTAFGSSAVKRAAMQLGASEFIDGLLDGDQLLGTVERLLVRKNPTDSITVEQFATGPATERWVALIGKVTMSSRDLPTLRHWGTAAGQSVGTLKRCCQASSTRASDSLHLARALRIVRLFSGRNCRWYDALDIKETTTMKTFLASAGFSATAPVPDLSTFLGRQAFVRDRVALDAIRAARRNVIG